jgi:hypothetical protein
MYLTAGVRKTSRNRPNHVLALIVEPDRLCSAKTMIRQRTVDGTFIINPNPVIGIKRAELTMLDHGSDAFFRQRMAEFGPIEPFVFRGNPTRWSQQYSSWCLHHTTGVRYSISDPLRARPMNEFST